MSVSQEYDSVSATCGPLTFLETLSVDRVTDTRPHAVSPLMVQGIHWWRCRGCEESPGAEER